MSTETDERVEIVPVHTIKPSEFALRSVDKNSEAYLELVDSIRSRGVLNPILVTDAGEGVFGLIDGLHRLSAAKDAGRQTIPVLVKSMAESQMMEAQIITNLHKVDTKPMEYTKQLFRLLSADPMLTKSELAEKLSVNVKWLDDRLSLSNLVPEIQELVNEGRIGLANAYALAKLPGEEQPDYVDRAMTEPPTQFVPLVSARQKQIKDAARQGKEASPAEFTAIPRLQSRATVEAELKGFKVGPKVLEKSGANTAQEGFQAALQWVLNLDADSVAAQRQRWEDRKKQREEARAKAKEDRERRKLEDAAKAQADIAKL